MKVIVLGSDGYIGWPLTVQLLEEGHSVLCCDDGSRRRRVNELLSDSLIPIPDIKDRKELLRITYPDRYINWVDVCLGGDQPGYIESILHSFQPDAVFHLAQQPSAPWSMMSVHKATATQLENVIGTLHLLWGLRTAAPNAHLIKIGTMGEYGTPNCIIPEGTIPQYCIGPLQDIYECPMAGLPFPRSPGSFYHLSKVHDTHNIIFACKTWGLKSTDIMQGIVFGNIAGTRFDYDECFGTVINRFCVEAVAEHPITVYGEGDQTRGFLPLKDSIQCLMIALTNPPAHGTYRVWNQYESVHTVNELAGMVLNSARSLDHHTFIQHYPNPRVELERHYYNPVNNTLFELGYRPTTDIEGEIEDLMRTILPYKDNIWKEVIVPRITWR